MVNMFAYTFDYRDRLARARRRKPLKGRRLTRAERYIQSINEGCGSREFKDYLNSKPLDKYLCYITKVPTKTWF